MRLRLNSLSGGLTGLLLAQGAPIGWALHQRFWGESWQLNLLYIWLGTSLFFSLFGFWAGRLVARVDAQRKQIEKTLEVSREFESQKKALFLGMIDRAQSPVSVTIEFLQSLISGDYGPISLDQRQMTELTLQELNRLQWTLRDLLQIQEASSKANDASSSNLGQIVDHVIDSLPYSEKNIQRAYSLSSKTRGTWVAGHSEQLTVAISHLLKAALGNSESKVKVEIASYLGHELSKSFSDLDPRVAELRNDESYICLSITGPSKTPWINHLHEPLNLDKTHHHPSVIPLGQVLVQEIARWNQGLVWVDLSHNDFVVLHWAFLSRRAEEIRGAA